MKDSFFYTQFMTQAVFSAILFSSSFIFQDLITDYFKRKNIKEKYKKYAIHFVFILIQTMLTVYFIEIIGYDICGLLGSSGKSIWNDCS